MCPAKSKDFLGGRKGRIAPFWAEGDKKQKPFETPAFELFINQFTANLGKT